MIVLIFLLYVVNSGKESTVSVFMYAVAVDTALRFTQLQGSLLTTGYYAGYAGGRAVYSILGIFIPVQVSYGILPIAGFHIVSGLTVSK